MTEPLHNADEELVIAIYRYFRRIRREQPTQLWLNEKLDNEFSALRKHIDRRFDMTVNTDQLAAAITPLSDAVTGAVTAINGFPQLVTDAVTKALAAAGADESAQQAIIDQATAEATADAQKLIAAVQANLTPPAA